MFKKSEFDSSWQEVDASANKTPSPANMASRQSSAQHFQRADSSFEHIDESIMVLNSVNPSMVSNSDRQPSIPAPAATVTNSSLALISQKLDLYLTQIDRFLNASKPASDADLTSDRSYQKYVVKLRSEVEALKNTASNYLGQEKTDPAKSSQIKSNLSYDIGKLDELMNNFYLNDTVYNELTSTSSTYS